MLNAKRAGDFAPAIGASVAIGLAKERGVRANVMLPYSDRLARFAAWYVHEVGVAMIPPPLRPSKTLGEVSLQQQIQRVLTHTHMHSSITEPHDH